MKRITRKFKKDNLRLAFDKCLNRLDEDNDLLGTSTSAGFLKTNGPTYQVFVELQEFDKTLLKNEPESGGLVKYSTQ